MELKLTFGEIKEIFNLSNSNFIDESYQYKKITNFNNLESNSISFSIKPFKYDYLNKLNNLFIIANIDKQFLKENKDSLIKNKIYILPTESPKYKYAHLIKSIPQLLENQFYEFDQLKHKFPTCSFENGVKISKKSIIGKNCIFKANSVVTGKVEIGDFFHLGENSVVGCQGFGVAMDGPKYIQIPHIGGVEIGSNVFISSNTTICRGTISNTILENNIMVDNHVHIAHNCIIKRDSIITASVTFGGSSIIEPNCFLSPSTNIASKVTLGNNSFTSIGSTLTKSNQANSKIYGLSDLSSKAIAILRRIVKSKIN